jgi:hypothetical protein
MSAEGNRRRVYARRPEASPAPQSDQLYGTGFLLAAGSHIETGSSTVPRLEIGPVV